MAGENQAGQGRKEAAYTCGIRPTEDAGMRRFAAGEAVCVLTRETTSGLDAQGKLRVVLERCRDNYRVALLLKKQGSALRVQFS